jgi:predicted nucleotidyltransferase
MGKDRSVRIVRKSIKALKQEGIPVDRVILYGSYAKGKTRPDSDIDVAVISKNFGQDRVEEGMTLFRISGKIDPRLEPIPISSESYQKDTWVPLIYEIKEKGIELEL